MNLVDLVRVGAAASALIVCAQANAADLGKYGGYSGFKDAPALSTPTIWSGFYLGVNGGYGWRQTSDQFAWQGIAQALDAYNGIGAAGGFGGGQIGYSWQGFLGMPAIVAGIETDIQGSGITGKGTDALGDSFKTSLDWFGTVRGRVGYSSGNALAYFTGGFAYGGLRQYAEDITPAIYKSDATVTGYVLGGGLEYKVTPSWSVKAEYQYLNFGKHDLPLLSGASAATASADGYKIGNDAFHTVRIGLNYWVDSAYEPLK